MKSKLRRAVAIVGGGASGTILAANLAKKNISAFLIDGSGRMGRGTAYSTTERAHLLNVRAEAMSALADESGHFADYFAAAGGDSRGFAPRLTYGRYLDELLDSAIATGEVEPVAASAVSTERNGTGWTILLDDGSALETDALVLAGGNQLPGGFASLGPIGDLYVRNPWGEEARSAISDLAASGGTALIIGTGLTMVDLVVSLEAAGHRGRIVAISRRGQIPRAHVDFEPAPVALDHLPVGNLRSLWCWLRRRSGEVGWRAAIDSLRPHSQALWQSLSHDQQRRFLRHARPWWDAHRHRIAPQIAAVVAGMIAQGQLEIRAGRVVAARLEDGRVENERAIVAVRMRGKIDIEEIRAGVVFDCTGPLQTMRRTRDPLLRGLIERGSARPDPLDIGIDVDSASRVTGSDRLWAIGPMTKGRYWEIVAVPDIRGQAAAIADDIARELGQ